MTPAMKAFLYTLKKKRQAIAQPDEVKLVWVDTRGTEPRSCFSDCDQLMLQVMPWGNKSMEEQNTKLENVTIIGSTDGSGTGEPVFIQSYPINLETSRALIFQPQVGNGRPNTMYYKVAVKLKDGTTKVSPTWVKLTYVDYFCKWVNFTNESYTQPKEISYVDCETGQTINKTLRPGQRYRAHVRVKLNP